MCFRETKRKKFKLISVQNGKLDWNKKKNQNKSDNKGRKMYDNRRKHNNDKLNLNNNIKDSHNKSKIAINIVRNGKIKSIDQTIHDDGFVDDVFCCFFFSRMNKMRMRHTRQSRKIQSKHR